MGAESLPWLGEGQETTPRDWTRADEGEVDKEQTLDAPHATVLDEHDDDERVSGEREQEDGSVEAEQGDRRRLADREHLGQVRLDQSSRRGLDWLGSIQFTPPDTAVVNSTVELCRVVSGGANLL